ncbi:MAG: DmsC/YnfH family molybdoenzyme membrane anchor subunit [Pseudomonadota bacterium]
MHPAYSVIVFTTASGAGYGLLFWLSLARLVDLLPNEGWMPFVSLVLALVLITTGLLASTLHLGHPERAIGAFSQWRSSWLSREGVLAVATYVPSGLLALIWLFGAGGAAEPALALLSALGAVGTVYCTGMIYGSLRTIRQWFHPLTAFVYLSLSAATGAILLGLLMSFFGGVPTWVSALVVTSLGVAAAIKLTYWHQIDADPGKYTAEMATGLVGPGGTVRPLDPPHTRPNFVMLEMGYQVGRKHALALRRLGVVLTFVVPGATALIVLFTSGWPILLYSLITLAAALGVLVERWLFFAQAEHVSQLFYGAARA